MKTYSRFESRADAEVIADRGSWMLHGARSITRYESSVDSLYKYIEIRELLGVFLQRLKTKFRIEGLRFEMNDSIMEVTLGSCLADNIYQVDFDGSDEVLNSGSLKLFRAARFHSIERPGIHSCIDCLQGPLRNAAQYARACASVYHDSLTGLKNRAAFDAFLRQGETRSGADSLLLLMCDLDRFKSINDFYGHAAGDEALKLFACKLESIFAQDDRLFRYGGDEFVVALENTSALQGYTLAQEILRSVATSRLYFKSNHIQLTATIGMAVKKPSESYYDSFLRADEALLRGKRSGRNKIVDGACNLNLIEQ